MKEIEQTDRERERERGRDRDRETIREIWAWRKGKIKRYCKTQNFLNFKI